MALIQSASALSMLPPGGVKDATLEVGDGVAGVGVIWSVSSRTSWLTGAGSAAAAAAAPRRQADRRNDSNSRRRLRII
jgi:hypothetical protein